MVFSGNEGAQATADVKFSSWSTATAEKVIRRLEERVEYFKTHPQPGTSAPSIAQQQAKFDVISDLIDEHRHPHPENARKPARLARIIRGYLAEFARQSEERVVPCNITNGRNPEAKKYWQDHPEEFRQEALQGIFHSAATYKALQRSFPRPHGHASLFHAGGEIIRSTIDVFKEEYPQYNPNTPPLASIYNDHDAVITFARRRRFNGSKALQADEPDEALATLPLTPQDFYQQWMDRAVSATVDTLKTRIAEFERNPQPGISAPSIAQQKKKFEVVTQLVNEYESLHAFSGRQPRRGRLERIIRGYLAEFVRQSEEKIEACNIEHNRNPDAKAYWDSRPQEEFEEASYRGKFHTAVSFLNLQSHLRGAPGRDALFHGVGEIIRSTIDTFKAKYAELNPELEPRASVYNDHQKVIMQAIEFAYQSNKIARR